MQYTIRICRRADIPALVELCRRHAKHEDVGYDVTGKSLLLERAIIDENPSLQCWVVERSASLVGYCTFTFDFSTWDAKTFLHLDCLYLDEESRGLGIGKKILQQLIEVATKRDCINIQWQTPHFNINAIKFYKAIGATSKDKVRFTYNI
jgi:ribosomal protein S18 acetylase RimI-like enzyme